MQISKKSFPANDPDARMMELKYAAPQIGKLSDAELSKWGKALLLKIHVITGWVVPVREFLNILVDQFQKTLREKYGMLNSEEVEYAFRSKGTIIEDWGKEMNLNLIDQVLISYLNDRSVVSDKEERMKEPPSQVILTDKQLDDIHRKDVEVFYQQLRNGVKPYSLPDYFKAILVKDGLMKQDESTSSFFVQRLGNGFKNIYVPVE